MELRHNKESFIDHLKELNARTLKSRSRKSRRATPTETSPPRHELIVIDKDGETDELFVIDKEGEQEVIVVEPTERGNTGSPSLEDLETRKKLLMRELEVGGASVQSFTPEQQASVGKVKHIDLGTPILKSASPYSRIPAADNFSIGIQDVINFENLPDSTGHYLRMNKVIHKIRKFNAGKLDDEES